MKIITALVLIVTMMFGGGNRELATIEPIPSEIKRFYLTLGVGFREIRDLEDNLISMGLGYDLNYMFSLETNLAYSDNSSTIALYGLYNHDIKNFRVSVGLGPHYTKISEYHRDNINKSTNSYTGLSGLARLSYFISYSESLYIAISHQLDHQYDPASDTYMHMGIFYRF